jgi:hypothetical protein
VVSSGLTDVCASAGVTKATIHLIVLRMCAAILPTVAQAIWNISTLEQEARDTGAPHVLAPPGSATPTDDGSGPFGSLFDR